MKEKDAATILQQAARTAAGTGGLSRIDGSIDHHHALYDRKISRSKTSSAPRPMGMI
jgi:hypothetical protein